MKMTILNGNPNPVGNGFDGWLGGLRAELEERGHQLTQLSLKDLDFRHCTGCFACWVKTPGECSFDDDSKAIRQAVIHSDLTLLASPLSMGFVSSLLKKANDRLLPLLHPYMTLVEGECHHINRYASYPKLALVVAEEQDTDAEDLEIVSSIYRRTALNFKSELVLSETTQGPCEEVADALDRL